VCGSQRINGDLRLFNGSFTAPNGGIISGGLNSFAAVGRITAADRGEGDLFISTADGELPGYPSASYPVLGTNSGDFYIAVGGVYAAYFTTDGYHQISDER